MTEHFVHTMRGEGAPPRSNGELLFDAPWEGRSFAIGVALSDAGVYSWADFQRALIRSIGAWERTHSLDDPDWRYYERWQVALEDLLTSAGLIDAAELEARTVDVLCADPSHEHRH